VTSLAVRAPLRARGDRVRAVKVSAALIAGGLLFGALAGQLSASGHAIDVVGLAAVLIPVAVWKRPHLGPVILIAAALLVEQVGQEVTPPSAGAPGVESPILTANIPITPHIPLFRGIGSLHLQPADLLLLVVFIIYLAKTAGTKRSWPRSHLSAGVYCMIGVVVLGIVIGVSHHGSLRVALMESRPYVYVAATYLLTSLLVTTKDALRSMLWALVIVVGVKALQGLYIFLSIRNMHPRPESVLGHEEAFFFGVFILLVAALWLFGIQGNLRKTATWLLPVVIAANLANNRRTAWVVLGVGLAVLLAIGLVCLPNRRRMLLRVLVVTLVISAVYFPLYWNKNGGLAQPARAVHSLISADHRDASSDLYRIQEDANLKLNIKEGGLLGKGFGVPIDYALPIANIKTIDPLIAYVPHNGVYYILMRMGLLGGIAFWALVGAAIVAGCRLAKSVDRELAVIGALVACSVVGYVFEGNLDQGFFFYRVAFLVGALLGLAEAAHRIRRVQARRAATRHSGRPVVMVKT
jgi:O-antigen ligase